MIIYSLYAVLSTLWLVWKMDGIYVSLIRRRKWKKNYFTHSRDYFDHICLKIERQEFGDQITYMHYFFITNTVKTVLKTETTLLQFKINFEYIWNYFFLVTAKSSVLFYHWDWDAFIIFTIIFYIYCFNFKGLETINVMIL